MARKALILIEGHRVMVSSMSKRLSVLVYIRLHCRLIRLSTNILQRKTFRQSVSIQTISMR